MMLGSVEARRDGVPACLASDSDLVSDLLWSPAVEMSGSGADDAHLLRAVAENFPGQAVCVVRHWMVIDVMFTQEGAPASWRPGLTRSVLYANSSIEVGESNCQRSEVVSGFAHRFEDYFFETEDKLYILAGRGFRRQASCAAFSALVRLLSPS